MSTTDSFPIINRDPPGLKSGLHPTNTNGEHGGGSSVGGVFGGVSVGNSLGGSLQYSMPGILSFLQHEWTRFELERQQWEVEKAELQARIAFLQGERKGQENLKNDLLRRIKMLEFALKQERAKNYKLKYGVDPPFDEQKAASADRHESEDEEELLASGGAGAQWRQSRQILRRYLLEIGMTDTVIDVRSARVRTLLGMPAEEDAAGRVPSAASAEDEANPAMSKPARPAATIGAADPLAGLDDFLQDAEAEEALAEFDFLSGEMKTAAHEAADAKPPASYDWDPDPSHVGNGLDDDWGVDKTQLRRLTEAYKREQRGRRQPSVRPAVKTSLQGVLSALPAEPGRDEEPRSMESLERNGSLTGFPGDVIQDGVELGDLSDITVTNDVENMDATQLSGSRSPTKKTWTQKYTLRSHFDGVRAVLFHPHEALVITASEDHLLKLWNLDKVIHSKKAVAADVEPIANLRGHLGPVLCATMGLSGEQCFSGGADGTIRCWNLPSANTDPYDAFEVNVLGETLRGHTDAVWSLSTHGAHSRLLSCSADGTVRVWQPGADPPLLSTLFETASSTGTPVVADFLGANPNQAAVAMDNCKVAIMDIATGQEVMAVDVLQPDTSNWIHRVRSHPTQPVLVVAQENKHIGFIDTRTGQLAHDMVAHLDAVTSVAVDSSGTFLLSASHDCSVRLWNFDSKTCVQEITAHRKKFDEAIFDVAFHPSKSLIASAGADAFAKCYV